MVSALVSVITYLMIGMFVATFLEVLENKHPKTIFADIALGKEGTDWYYFFMTVLFFSSCNINRDWRLVAQVHKGSI